MRGTPVKIERYKKDMYFLGRLVKLPFLEPVLHFAMPVPVPAAPVPTQIPTNEPEEVVLGLSHACEKEAFLVPGCSLSQPCLLCPLGVSHSRWKIVSISLSLSVHINKYLKIENKMFSFKIPLY